jgi:hypothetical protein
VQIYTAFGSLELCVTELELSYLDFDVVCDSSNSLSHLPQKKLKVFAENYNNLFLSWFSFETSLICFFL